MAFIAFDWCGWNERQGRFTHMPSGDTLRCQDWMGQREWDKAQLAFFQKYPGLTVYKNLHSGPYNMDGESMGTTEEICTRLEKRFQ